MKQEKEYFTFISYKRDDEKWAKWLAHELDSYKLPSSLNGKDMPPSLRKTFRDVDELSAGNLPKQIYKALSMSDNLIVVCSPLAAKSEWVKKEIEDFIINKGGKADHIFPFIIDGIPFSKDEKTECFPEILRNLPKSEERLGGNINEQGGKNAAVVKVISGMLGVSFDSLWQRYEREQKLKRLMWLVGGIIIALIGLCIGAYFIKQNHVIAFQNEQLQNLVRNLEEENNTYSQLESDKKQYYFAGQVRGKGCAEFSSRTFAYHPYEPIVAFSDDWGVWLHYLNSNVEIQLPTIKGELLYNIEELHFSADGTELLVVGSSVYIWDVESCKLISHYPERDESIINSQDIKNRFHYYGNVFTQKAIDYRQEKFRYEYNDGKLSIFKKTTTELICSTDMENKEDSTSAGLSSLRNPVYYETLFITDKRAALYDEEKKEFVLFFKGGYEDEYDIEFSESGEFIRVGKNIYARTFKPETIQNMEYTVKPISEFPNFGNEKNYRLDISSRASIDIDGDKIIYRRGSFVKEIEVVNVYTSGTLHDCLSDAIFAGSYKIVAIQKYGRHQIYNTKTWEVVGILNDWFEDETNIEGERKLHPLHTYYVSVKFINQKLYVLKSDGIMKIYNVDRCRLEKVVVLPIDNHGEEYFGPIEQAYLADNGSEIYYSYVGQSMLYHCYLPIIK